MAITFVTSATGKSATDGAAFNVSISGAQSGDLIVVISSNSTYLNSAGYNTVRNGATVAYTRVTSLANTAAIASSPCATIDWRFWANSNDDTVAIGAPIDPNGGAEAVVFVFRGVDTTTPIDVTATTASGSSTNPNPPAITPTSNNCCILAAAAGGANDATPGTVTNYTEPAPFTINGQPWGVTRNLTTAMAYRILSGGAGASEDPAAYSSWSTGRWVSFTVALRPLSASVRSYGFVIG